MIHVRKCPYGHRGKPSTEFFKDGKPQIYCMGWIDKRYDEPIDICENCPDFVFGEQCNVDFIEAMKNNQLT